MRFVESMMLKSGDAVNTHGLDPQHTCNPVTVRYYDALFARALDPNCRLPQLSPKLSSVLLPDAKVCFFVFSNKTTIFRLKITGLLPGEEK